MSDDRDARRSARDARRGQASQEETEDEARAKREEKERKKAEVRKRLEEASKAKKGVKKGFLNPERKRKLRTLLMKKAADDMKAEQERKAQERRRILEERIGADQHNGVDSESHLKEVCKKYHDRIRELEETRYDLEVKVRAKDYELNELTIQVNDLRGKFVKPTLKKVAKYETKFSKMEKKGEAGAVDFRSNLKSTGINKFALEEETKDKTKPEWAAKKEEEAVEA
ncbi:troponin I 4-like [Paramacrobiotus metropolitanus]|uniref:troponin I 4-like n=1 Tax=Paramacrobiotus metropolitanus TaxID=2943436 RepID=UPI0024456499|nr:troponin I 4-like [Paramacrobiotus metropolitanus]